MNPDTNFYVHDAQGPSESQAKATVPKSLHFSPVPHGLLMPGDTSMSLSHDTHHRNVWISSHPLIWRGWFQFRVLPILTPFLGLCHLSFLNCSLRHCQVSSIEGNVNSGELSVVSDFVRQNCLVASVTECQCHSVTSEARGSRSSGTALDISPSQAMRSYVKKKKLKINPTKTHITSGAVTAAAEINQPPGFFFLWCLHKDLPLDQYSEL